MSNRMLNDGSTHPTPLVWWRSLPADELGVGNVGRLRRAMRDLQIFGEPEWNAAVSGDAAEAIGVAIRVAVTKPCIEPVVDLVMSAVLGAAIEEDHGARHFLAHMLRKRVAADPPRKVSLSHGSPLAAPQLRQGALPSRTCGCDRRGAAASPPAAGRRGAAETPLASNPSSPSIAIGPPLPAPVTKNLDPANVPPFESQGQSDTVAQGERLFERVHEWRWRHDQTTHDDAK